MGLGTGTGIASWARISCAAAVLLWAPSAAPQDLAEEIKDLNWVGFQQLQEASRVFVRTTEPARYTIDSSRPDMVVVILQNTRVALRNNRRPLDTRYFDSPVTMVVPKVIEGPSASVRIEIHLRKKVAFRQVQNDNVLSLFFDRS